LLTGKEPQSTPLRVDLSGFYARDNAKEHHTDQFELVQDPTATPVFRRGLPFFFAVRFDRQYDPIGDVIRLQFGFGESSSQQVRENCDFLLRHCSCILIDFPVIWRRLLNCLGYTASIDIVLV
jgi:hypothetical protein